MKVISTKAVKTILKKTLKPALSVGLCVCFTLVLSEYLMPVFDKFALVSAVVCMPQESFSVMTEGYKTGSEKETESVTVLPENLGHKEEIKEETSSQSTSSSAPIERPKDAGNISEYAIKPSKTSSKIIWKDGAAFSNTSSISNNDILKILNNDPVIKLKKNAPQVLIYHTHSTESYEMQDLGWYQKDSAARTTDQSKNMIRVGEEIVKKLKEAGIEVIHDKTIYDYPSYNGAYNRSAETVKKYLKKYPSITVTLDIHRDAIEQSGGVRVKPTAVINGKKAAQVMIIAGVDDGTMDFKNWRENMKFASSLQVEMEQNYSGLTRAVMVCHRRYNMYLTNNSLLIEVGGHANTLDEAVYSGDMIGVSLSKVLKEKGKFES